MKLFSCFFALLVNLQAIKASCGGDYVVPRNVQCGKCLEAIEEVRCPLTVHCDRLRRTRSDLGVILFIEPEGPWRCIFWS